MQHINLSNYKGSITDWTELNYINGGLADNLADIANIKVNDSCYNYLAKSENLINKDYVIQDQGTWIVTRIYVKPNTTYTFNRLVNNSGDIKECDVNGGTIRNIAFGNLSTNTYTSSANASYIDISFHTSYFNTGMFVEGTTLPTAYEPYGALVIHQNAREVVVNRNSSYLWISGTYKYATLNVDGLFKLNGNISITGNDNIVSGIYASNGNIMFEFETAYSSADELKLAMEGVIVKFELATPQIIVLKSVDLGTLNWEKLIEGDKIRFVAYYNNNPIGIKPSGFNNSLSINDYGNQKTAEQAFADNSGWYVGATGMGFYTKKYETANDFKASMSGVILLYEPKE